MSSRSVVVVRKKFVTARHDRCTPDSSNLLSGVINPRQQILSRFPGRAAFFFLFCNAQHCDGVLPFHGVMFLFHWTRIECFNFPMKVLLLDSETARYYAGPDEWVGNSSDALDLIHVKRAVRLNAKCRLGATHLVFAYTRPICTLKVPISFDQPASESPGWDMMRSPVPMAL